MNRETLVKHRSRSWKQLEALLDKTDKAKGAGGLRPDEIKALSEEYRSLASDLMRVRRDKLGADLERHLDGLASRAHNVIYGGSSVGQELRPFDLLLDFPGAVRRNVRFFALSFVLFFLPLGLAGLAAWTDESYALSILSAENLEQVERMYEAASPDQRDVNTDSQMTGFYVFNNVGIALRTFATGLFFGLGSMFYLLFNGLNIGVVLGHLTRHGLGPKIFSFISSHGPWELVAIVIAGGAGIQMGYALVSTHGRTRFGNLQAHGLELLRQVMGAATFLVGAALIEGNLSPSALPNEAKYVIGALGWVLVFGILFGVGRRRRVPADVHALKEPP